MKGYYKYGLYVNDSFMGYTNSKEKIIKTISRTMTKALQESATVDFRISNVKGVNMAGSRRL